MHTAICALHIRFNLFMYLHFSKRYVYFFNVLFHLITLLEIPRIYSVGSRVIC
jgi:hypothetical protein